MEGGKSRKDADIKTSNFEAEIPKGAQIVSLAGVFGDKKLLTLKAYYN